MLSETERPKQDAQHKIIKELTKEIDLSFERLINTPRAERELSILNEVRELWTAFRDTRDSELIPGIYAGRIDKARALALGIQKERYERFATLTKKLVEMKTREMEEAVELSSRQHRNLSVSFFMIGFLSVSASIVMAIFLIKGIVTPVLEVAKGARRIADGDLETVVDVRSRDEIGIMADTFNSMSSRLKQSFEEQKRLFSEEQRKVRQLSILREAVTTISSELELEPLLEKLAFHAASLIQAELSALVVLHPVTGGIQHFKANIPKESFPVKTTPEGKGLLGVVLKEGETILLDDVTADPRFTGLPSGHPFLRTLLGIPMLLKGMIIGGIFVANKKAGETFTQEDEDLLLMFSLQSATAIENARLYAKTVELAATDGLTGLTNRRVFQERLSDEFARSERYVRHFSILIIDIDHFKTVNDTYGHQAGDSVLRSLGNLLKEKTRKVDLVARYGGEEFVLIFPETSEPQAIFVAERIRKAVAQTPFIIPDGKHIALTVSIGIAAYPRCGSTTEEMINRADQSLYQAKQTGRNRVCVC